MTEITIYQTTILITLLLVAALAVVPRKYFVLPFILAACFVPADQRVIIMGLDFTCLRILVVVGFVRIIVQGRYRNIKWNNFDAVMLAWIVCGTVIYFIQWLELQAIIRKSGTLFDMVGLYWIFRKNIGSWDKVRIGLKIFALCAIIMAPLVMIEWATGNNPFAVLGNVSTVVRESGSYRCQASFPHSIIMGLFWATLVPLFIGMAMTEKNKVFYWIATGAGVFMVAASASSTPVLTLMAALFVLCMFKLRRFTSCVAAGGIIMLVCLHLIMNAPVWHLISRVNVIGGSTGWHRYHIIEQAIEHFDEWALIGCKSVEHWGWLNSDLTNQYVLEGVFGGLVTLILFVVMLCYGLNVLLSNSLRDRTGAQQRLSWYVFAAVIGHCVAFMGVSYFGQITMLLYMLLAIVGFIAERSYEGKEVLAGMFAVEAVGNYQGYDVI